MKLYTYTSPWRLGVMVIILTVLAFILGAEFGLQLEKSRVIASIEAIKQKSERPVKTTPASPSRGEKSSPQKLVENAIPRPRNLLAVGAQIRVSWGQEAIEVMVIDRIWLRDMADFCQETERRGGDCHLSYVCNPEFGSANNPLPTLVDICAPVKNLVAEK